MPNLQELDRAFSRQVPRPELIRVPMCGELATVNAQGARSVCNLASVKAALTSTSVFFLLASGDKASDTPKLIQVFRDAFSPAERPSERTSIELNDQVIPINLQNLNFLGLRISPH